MFRFVPDKEKRFRFLFLYLLFPWGIACVFICGVGAIATVFGENIPVINDRPVPRVIGAVICLAAFPFFTILFAFVSGCSVYFNRHRRGRNNINKNG